MNWKNYCDGFAIQKSNLDWEGKCLCSVGAYHRIPHKLISRPIDVPIRWVPSGNVPWVSEIIGETIRPDYFPKFLSKWVSRHIWETDSWPLGKKVFIKPSDRHKRFTGFITSGTYRGKKRGPYLCSDIVKFTNEWRYYVAYGKLIGAYWYWGDGDAQLPAPVLDVNWPDDWCGTADFGSLDVTGDIQLIETHPPFACGWYGKNHEEYAEFLTLGWKWLQEKRYKQSF